MRQSRRGFTLIEILVVIGIIMILVSLLFYGFRSMNRSAAGNETKAELKVCKGMLAEYEGKNQLQGIEWVAPGGVQQVDPGAPPGTPGKFPVYPEPDAYPPSNPKEYKFTFGNGTPYWGTLLLADISGTGTPPNNDMGDKSGTGPRYGNATQLTLEVMYVLMRIPANQTLLQGIQAKRLLEPLPSVAQQNTTQQGNVLLDGWGNPILFVPRGGLHTNILQPNGSGQMVPTAVLVRSTGTLALTSSASDPPLTGAERPFFASAGQDGDFTQGEDNIYSFQD